MKAVKAFAKMMPVFHHECRALSVCNLPSTSRLPPEEALLDDAGGYLHLGVDVLDPSVRRPNYLPGPVPCRLHRAGAMLTEISP